MKIQKREKEPVDQEFSDKIESKKINQNKDCDQHVVWCRLGSGQ